MLSEMARIDIESLQKSGFQPTPADIVYLNDIALEIQRLEDGNAVMHPRSALAGNVMLFQPTVASTEWWEQFGKNVFEGEETAYGLFFSMANAKSPEILDTLVDDKAILKAVRKWKRGTAATFEQLWKAMLWCKFGNDIPQFKEERENLAETMAKRADVLDLIWGQVLQVSGITGIRPEELRTRTQDELQNMLIQSLWLQRGVKLKKPFAEKYIAYKKLIREIENRGKADGTE